MEMSGQQLNYLDPNIRPEFAIYRRNKFSGVSVNSRYYHPEHYKLAAITSVIHRLTVIPMNQELWQDIFLNAFLLRRPATLSHLLAILLSLIAVHGKRAAGGTYSHNHDCFTYNENAL